MSQDFIMDPVYASLEDSVHSGVTMLTFTGDNNMTAVNETFSDWTVDAVSKDATLLEDLKNVMLYQNYALANSNALDGFSSNTRIESVRTWYDNLITGLQVLFGVLTVLTVVMYIKNVKKKEEN